MTEQGDDGKLPDAELESKRTERFQKDPYSFIEISELICGVMRSPEASLGISIFIGNAKRSELDISLSELTLRIQDVLRRMALEAEMKKGSIQKPHSIFDFARKKK